MFVPTLEFLLKGYLMAKMLGATTPVGIGGKYCACCKVAPGRARTVEKRTTKRRERQSWRREVSE
jgi:hypothetical protein